MFIYLFIEEFWSLLSLQTEKYIGPKWDFKAPEI